MKCSVFLTILLIVGVNTLNCYVTEVEPHPVTGFFKNTLKERNCYQSKSVQLEIVLPENGDVSCYKIAGIDSVGNNKAIKGCSPRGKCESQEILTNVTKSYGFVVDDVKCYECGSDFCNSGTKIGSTDVLFLLAWMFVLF